MTKKTLIKKLLDSSGDSYDLIALRADCSVSYVKKVEKEREKIRTIMRPKKPID